MRKKLYHYPPMLILTILAVFALIVFETAAFINHVLFKPEIYSEAMGSKSVSKAIYNDLDEYFESYQHPTNIPKEVYMQELDEKELYKTAYTLLEDSLAYLTDSNAPKPEIKYDYTPFEEAVVGYIEDYSEKNGIEKNDEYYKLIDNTISTAETQIEIKFDVLMLYQLSNSKLAPVVHKASGFVLPIELASAIMLVILLMLMFVVDRHHVRDMPYWLGLLIFVPSVVFLVPSVYLKKTEYFETFFVRNEHIYRTVTGFFSTALNRIIDVQSLLLAFSVVLMISTLVIHSMYVKYRRKKSRQS